MQALDCDVLDAITEALEARTKALIGAAHELEGMRFASILEENKVLDRDALMAKLPNSGFGVEDWC